MAKKVAVSKEKKPIKLAVVTAQLETLKNTIREYFNHIKYRSPEYTIKLNASISGENGAQKVHMVNVPSLIASITTAQHLNKEIRLKAVEDPTGGALLIEFYTPVQIERNGPMLLS
jgi:hypothetical protein